MKDIQYYQDRYKRTGKAILIKQGKHAGFINQNYGGHKQ